MKKPTNQLTLTDAVIRSATLPLGKAQHYLHDDKLPGLALRMRATGGRTWVYLFTRPGVKGTQRKTLGAWPKYNERAARKAAPSPLARSSRAWTRTKRNVRRGGNRQPKSSVPRWRASSLKMVPTRRP